MTVRNYSIDRVSQDSQICGGCGNTIEVGGMIVFPVGDDDDGVCEVCHDAEGRVTMEFRSTILEHSVEDCRPRELLDTMQSIAEATAEFARIRPFNVFTTRVEVVGPRRLRVTGRVFLVLTNVEITDERAGDIVFQHLVDDAGVVDGD